MASPLDYDVRGKERGRAGLGMNGRMDGGMEG